MKIISTILSILIILSISLNGSSIETSPIEESIFNNNLINQTDISKDTYSGHLRIYVVEPSSRWDNFDRDPYHFGFLDFAFDDTLSLRFQETFTDSITWDGSNFNNLKEDNIMVMAAVFNQEINTGYSDPPSGNPFDAHYVDAAAAAKPGETGTNTVNEDFTHTVFVEEGTATWCPYCPAMAEGLYSVYETGDIPFYFVALVADENEVAHDYLGLNYNQEFYPTGYFDGGKKVVVGGYEGELYYRTRINSCSKSDVHDLDLSISLEWLGNSQLQIDISVTNIENSPPGTPTITGTTSGRSGSTYDYKVSTTDPDGDDVYYWIEWFESCPGVSWQGPYASGEEVTFSNTWGDEGTFNIKVKAKDELGAESDWAELEISMPKIKTFNQIPRILVWLFERFPSLQPYFSNFYN